MMADNEEQLPPATQEQGENAEVTATDQNQSAATGDTETQGEALPSEEVDATQDHEGLKSWSEVANEEVAQDHAGETRASPVNEQETDDRPIEAPDSDQAEAIQQSTMEQEASIDKQEEETGGVHLDREPKQQETATADDEKQIQEKSQDQEAGEIEIMKEDETPSGDGPELENEKQEGQSQEAEEPEEEEKVSQQEESSALEQETALEEDDSSQRDDTATAQETAAEHDTSDIGQEEPGAPEAQPDTQETAQMEQTRAEGPGAASEGEGAAQVEQSGEVEQNAETEQNAEVEQSEEVEQNAETEQNAEVEQNVETERNGETEQNAEVEQNAEMEQNAEVEQNAETEQNAEAEQNAETDQNAEVEQIGETEQNAEIEQNAEVAQAEETAQATEAQEVAGEEPATEAQQEAEEAPVEPDLSAGDATQTESVHKEAAPVEAESTQLSKEPTDLNENATDDAPPTPPHLPSRERSHTSIEGQMSTSALNVVWSFGLNRNVPVLNLSDGVRHAIMYPCAHVGIMYDFKNNKQHILQAHLNPITCTAASQDKRWLVTGDIGPDAMVNIWDTYTGIPIQTMFDPNPSGGVVAVALTPDSRYLATLSALPVQTLAIWDWTVDGDVPICSADLKPDFGVQNFICFDPTDIHHVVTNSETQVLFYHWEDHLMKYYAPPLTDNDFNKPVGRYSQSIFQKGIARALTATSIGNLVVWDNNKPLSKFMDVNQSADKKPLKIIRIHDKGINVLTTTESYIVVGDTAGHVKFFDQGLRLIYWYQDFHSGPCTAVSFAHMPDFSQIPHVNHEYPSDATKNALPFVVRDFVVGTAIAVYGNIKADGSKFKIIHREHDAAVHALAAHPRLPVIAMGSYSGLLKLWNYKTKEVVASRMFEKAHIHSVCFDPRGFCIVVGCANGTVYVVDSVALLDNLSAPFRYTQDCITHIAFAHNTSYFATADAGFAVTVFKRQRKEGRNPFVWHGRYRSHYKTIKDLLFVVDPDTNNPKLLSLGEDRMLIEYDMHHVGKTNNHVVPAAIDRIEQSALPMCMTSYPPITKESFILTANDQFKLKCYNSTTKMCRKTVLGPTYGSPIKKMVVVPATEGSETKSRYLAYITDDKVGLHILPATGNPHLAMALIAHPSGVSNLACSFDGTYLFTAGGPDYAVHMWEINMKALQAQAKLGGEDLIPFYGLLDGGRDGEMFAELEDLFYYAQLRHQGINSTEKREIGTRIPITEVPFVMRAMGYYPSEQEIEDMLNEIKYEEYVHSGQYQEDIDLGSFIKLYVNHRPAFGLSADKLLWAFNTLAESQGSVDLIERGDLLEILQKKGEHMTEYELAEHLTTLLGFNQEGGSCEQEPFEADKAGAYIAEHLPYDISSEVLVNEILGFSLHKDIPSSDDTRDVIKFSSAGPDMIKFS